MQPELVGQANQGLMGAARELAHRLHLPTTFMKFAIVGGMGFLVGQFVIFLVYDLPFLFLADEKRAGEFGPVPDLHFLIATIVAVETAIIFQFNSHERWTFRKRPRSGLAIRRFAQFNLSAGVGAIIIVIASTVIKTTLDPVPSALAPYLSFACGVAIGFVWNWTLNTLVIWPAQGQTAEIDDPAVSANSD